MSRIEEYLVNCCEMCGCEGLPAPISNTDKLLYHLADKIAQSRTHWVEHKEVTFECDAAYDNELEGFPVFAVGDTVNVKVDGVEYSLVAFEDNGFPVIGDKPENVMAGEGGEYGWFFALPVDRVVFVTTQNHVVSFVVDVVHKIDPKFLPDGIGNKFVAYIMENDDGNLVCDKTFEEIEAAMETQTVVLDCYGMELKHAGGVQGRNHSFSGVDFGGFPVLVNGFATIRKNGEIELSAEQYDLSSLKMG